MEKKRILALLLSICILWGMALPVSAEGTNQSETIMESILNPVDGENTAAGNVTFSDNQWHVLAFTAGDGYVSVSADGVSGTTGSDGYYAATKWNGFLTRGGELTSLSIGGFSSPNVSLSPYGNWIGEIASITFTDEVLAPVVADQLTAALKADSIDMTLSNNIVTTPETVGSIVGNFTFRSDAFLFLHFLLNGDIRKTCVFGVRFPITVLSLLASVHIGLGYLFTPTICSNLSD